MVCTSAFLGCKISTYCTSKKIRKCASISAQQQIRHTQPHMCYIAKQVLFDKIIVKLSIFYHTFDTISIQRIHLEFWGQSNLIASGMLSFITAEITRQCIQLFFRDVPVYQLTTCPLLLTKGKNCLYGTKQGELRKLAEFPENHRSFQIGRFIQDTDASDEIGDFIVEAWP